MRSRYKWKIQIKYKFHFQVIIYRTSFDEIQRSTVLIWFALDYFADFIYLMDILIHFRTGKKPGLRHCQWSIVLCQGPIFSLSGQSNYKSTSTQINERLSYFTASKHFRLPGGWSSADRNSEATPTLHEHHNILHRPVVLVTPGRPLLVPQLSVHVEDLPSCQNLPILGIFGQDRAPHQLSQSLPFV